MVNDTKQKPLRDTQRGRAVPDIREAHDAKDHEALKVDPTDEEARLDIALDESFPTSDAPGHTALGGDEPAPSSGYDEEAEQKLRTRRERAYALWEREGRPEGRHAEHWTEAGVGDTQDK